MIDPGRLRTLSQLERLYVDEGGTPLFNEATVRGWIGDNLRDFEKVCVVRVGGRTMVDLDAFVLWLEGQRGAPSLRQRKTRRPKVIAPVRALRPWSEIEAEANRASRG